MFNKLARMRATLSRAEWTRLGLCYAVVLRSTSSVSACCSW